MAISDRLITRALVEAEIDAALQAMRQAAAHDPRPWRAAVERERAKTSRASLREGGKIGVTLPDKRNKKP